MSEIVKKMLERLYGDRKPVSGLRVLSLIEQQQIFEVEKERGGEEDEPWVASIHRKRKPISPELQQAIDEGWFPPVD